jgi:DNA (cytosine-5)-methyltransferase 1
LTDVEPEERGIDNGAPTVVDIFAAPGGLAEGFRQAGYRVHAVVDSDPWGCRTLVRNHARYGTLVIEADIRNISLKGKVDVVVGGPPCQGFSKVGKPKIKAVRRDDGKRKYVDSRNWLYRDFIRIVRDLNPQFFVMENVPSILTWQGGKLLKRIKHEFRLNGYESVDSMVLNAAEYGVPQVRKRAFIVGNRLHVRNPVPLRTHYDPRVSHSEIFEIRQEMRPYVSVRDAISDLPALRAGEGSNETEHAHFIGLTLYQEYVRNGSRRLYNHVARKHSKRDMSLFRRLKEGEWMRDLPMHLQPYDSEKFADKMKKQCWDRPSSTILAHLSKDGLMFIHPDRHQARSFTPREAARLQSFQDTYVFEGPMTVQFKQVGNAVPPLLAKAVARAIRPHIRPIIEPTLSYSVLKTTSRISRGEY